MRRHNNRAAQLAIHTKQRVQEILLRNRIKTADEMEQEAANYVINPRSSS